jgi:hypothetical protein
VVDIAFKPAQYGTGSRTKLLTISSLKYNESSPGLPGDMSVALVTVTWGQRDVKGFFLAISAVIKTM